MTVLIVLLTIVEVLAAVLLVLLVLIQRSKDEGLGMAFGNAMGESLFGAQAGTFLTKGTVILGIVFMANTIALDRLYSHSVRSGTGSVMDSVPEAAAAPAPIETAPLMTDESGAPASGPIQPALAPDEVPLNVQVPMPAMPVPAAAPEAPAATAPVAAPVETPPAAPAATPQP